LTAIQLKDVEVVYLILNGAMEVDWSGAEASALPVEALIANIIVTELPHHFIKPVALFALEYPELVKILPVLVAQRLRVGDALGCPTATSGAPYPHGICRARYRWRNALG
jgi:hypothetical protein